MTQNSDDLDTEGPHVQVGDCPDCGYVVSNTIDFPGTPTCDCGQTLEKATVAHQEEVERHV